MNNLTIVDFQKPELPNCSELYFELKELLDSKYGHFTFIEIIGLLEIIKSEYINRIPSIQD